MTYFSTFLPTATLVIPPPTSLVGCGVGWTPSCPSCEPFFPHPPASSSSSSNNIWAFVAARTKGEGWKQGEKEEEEAE